MLIIASAALAENPILVTNNIHHYQRIPDLQLEKRTNSLNWLVAFAGLWLAVSPFVLNFTATIVTWNSVIVGIVTIVLSVWAALLVGRMRPQL